MTNQVCDHCKEEVKSGATVCIHCGKNTKKSFFTEYERKIILHLLPFIMAILLAYFFLEYGSGVEHKTF